MSSNCRRKIWPQIEAAVADEDDFNEDWDMVLENVEVEPPIEEAVDIVVRQQPSKVETGAFYRNSRRMIVHQVQGVEMVKPNCGNCCILQ